MRKVAMIFGVAGGVLGLVGLVLAVHIARIVVNIVLVVLGATDTEEPLMQPWDGVAMAAYISAWPVLLCATLALAGAIATTRRPRFAAGLFALSAAGMGATLQLFSVPAAAALLSAAIWAVLSDRGPFSRTSAGTWAGQPGLHSQHGTSLAPVAIPVVPYSRVRGRSGAG